jgi:hypothetical protein
MQTIEIVAQAYGRALSRRVYWFLPLVVLAPALAFVAMPERVPDVARFAPFMSIPAIAVMVFMFAGMRQRQINIVVKGRFVTVKGWQRAPYEGSVVNVEVVPWVLPGLGVAQGSAAYLQLEGQSQALCVGAWGYAAPAHAQRSARNPDCFVDAKVFSSLLAALGEAQPSADQNARETRFTVIRHKLFADAFGSMVWWFGTMAFLGVFGALAGEKLMQQPWGQAAVGIVCLVVMGFGLAKTFAKSQREKPKCELTIDGGAVTLKDPKGKTVWNAAQGAFDTTRATYVYRTKYGSHRFPVLVLAKPGETLRLGVWDTQPQWQHAEAPLGPAPQYLVAAPDWDRLLAAFRHRG